MTATRSTDRSRRSCSPQYEFIAIPLQFLGDAVHARKVRVRRFRSWLQNAHDRLEQRHGPYEETAPTLDPLHAAGRDRNMVREQEPQRLDDVGLVALLPEELVG